jgi:hypothetical protein
MKPPRPLWTWWQACCTTPQRGSPAGTSPSSGKCLLEWQLELERLAAAVLIEDLDERAR